MNKDLGVFAFKKFISALVSLWVIITMTFFLMKAVPGDPLTQEQSLPTEIYESLRAYYGLDRPLLMQYGETLKNILSLDLGPSLIYAEHSTAQIIQDAFPVSLLLGLEALFIALFFGISIGVLSAIKKESAIDEVFLLSALLFLSVPSFILATILQYTLGMQCDLLPVARWGSFSQSIMPALALSAMPAAFLAKLVRSSMIDVLNQDYMVLARAKGLPYRLVILRHGLQNALPPLLGYIGKMSGNILVGSFIIEKIFCIPGLGYWFVASISNRDYPMIMGLTIFYSAILLSMLFVAEVLHAIIDSRLYRRQEAFIS